ncbi:MAG: N-acetyltransferase [Planctomycetaceae bacterium]|nr:N-acetyltransferase [Planctomycetaceae bacterium]
MPPLPPPRIHPSAIIERDVTIGPGSSVWDAVHIRHGATLGEQCIVGEKSYIAYDVRIGHRVKINAMVYICYGVTIEDGVMISAGAIFTNDVFPRATTPDLRELRSSAPDEETQQTLVAAGATIGAGCTIGSNLRIGRFAMVGMGSVVTRDVGDFQLVVGNPARSIGAVCCCGHPVARWTPGEAVDLARCECGKCGAAYAVSGGVVTQLGSTPAPRETASS